MATQVWKNPWFNVNGVMLACNVESLSLSYEAESLEATVMGSNSRIKAGGLKSQGIDVTFFQNFACVDATLFGLVGCQTCIEIRACYACSAAANPVWEGTFLLQSYPPFGGAVGDILKTAVRFESAGDLRHCAVTTA